MEITQEMKLAGKGFIMENKTKEAIEAALKDFEDMSKNIMRGGKLFVDAKCLETGTANTIQAVLKAVLASLPDEGELSPWPTWGSSPLDAYICRHTAAPPLLERKDDD